MPAQRSNLLFVTSRESAGSCGLVVHPEVAGEESLPLGAEQAHQGDSLHHPALLTAPVKGHPLHLPGIGLILQHQQPRKPGLPATAPPCREAAFAAGG